MNLTNILENVIDETVFTKLGSGSFGTAYEKENKVYKITEDEEEVELCYTILQSKHKFRHFPEIYAIRELSAGEDGDDRWGIVRKSYRRLDEVPALRDVKRLIKQYWKKIIFHIPNPTNPLPDEVRENTKLMDTIAGIRHELGMLHISDYKLIDFHPNNLGVDENNNIVLFDF